MRGQDGKWSHFPPLSFLNPSLRFLIFFSALGFLSHFHIAIYFLIYLLYIIYLEIQMLLVCLIMIFLGIYSLNWPFGKLLKPFFVDPSLLIKCSLVPHFLLREGFKKNNGGKCDHFPSCPPPHYGL